MSTVNQQVSDNVEVIYEAVRRTKSLYEQDTGKVGPPMVPWSELGDAHQEAMFLVIGEAEARIITFAEMLAQL